MSSNRRHLWMVVLSQLLLAGVVMAQGKPDTEGWFPFAPDRDFERPSAFDSGGLLHRPAGKHGVVRIDEGHSRLVFEDGTPIRFWGTNICSGRPAAERADAEAWAAQCERYGVNLVRFHKFLNRNHDGIAEHDDQHQLNPRRTDRFDYFHAQLKQRGVYVGWSPIYGYPLTEADRDRVVAYDEIMSIDVPWHWLNATTSFMVNFAEDLQAINIEGLRLLLNHRNPYTGLRYADDPALAFVEIQNEDTIWWGAHESALRFAPTYRRMLHRKFAEWLKAKYGGQAALVAAWGREHLPEDQTLEAGNIAVSVTHGYYTDAYRRAGDEPIPTHVADQAAFLYDEQLAFYRKAVKAMRDEGYQGVIVGSCWQAGSGVTHFLNLHTDSATGMIDRHNYFGNQVGYRTVDGEVKPNTMLRRPGSGLLSTGLQQVEGRPFNLSEWQTVGYSPFAAADHCLIAIYGLGLQGWDGSQAFATDRIGFADDLHRHNWNNQSPLTLGLYPFLGRMVIRGDVAEGPIVSRRNVHVPSLREGRIGFAETVDQDFDVKSFEGVTPQEALAVGRTVVRYTDEPQPTEAPDLARHWDPRAKIVRSATGQLAWDYAGDGFVTVNTPRTVGVVGFPAQPVTTLGSAAITLENDYGVVLVTVADAEPSIAEARRLLVLTVARAHNTGVVFNEAGDGIEEHGGGPILMEPVVATLDLGHDRPVTVHALDHMGRRGDRSATTSADRIRLDGRETKTMYYELVIGE